MYVCVHVYTYACICESGRFSHQLSVKAEKTTLTKLKHMYSLTFWMVSFQAAAAPNVPARQVTHGALSPLGRILKGVDRLHTGQQAGSREKYPDATEHLAVALSPGEKVSGHLGSSLVLPHRWGAHTNLHLLFRLFYACLLGLEGAFHKSIVEISHRTEGLHLSGKLMLVHFCVGISSSPAAIWTWMCGLWGQEVIRKIY